jgi:hypothetical protein
MYVFTGDRVGGQPVCADEVGANKVRGVVWKRCRLTFSALLVEYLSMALLASSQTPRCSHPPITGFTRESVNGLWCSLAQGTLQTLPEDMQHA